MDTPISLEDLCYLHIISHLEHYPLHNLAKLSCPVRRRLLQNLPASDIIELENTCVADGIGDFEDEVWKQSCVCQCYEKESRESFLNAVWTGLFCYSNKVLLGMFYSVPKCLGLADLTSFTSVACDNLDRLVPSRYADLFDHSLMSLSELHARVIIILNKAGFKPTKIDTRAGFAIDLNSRYISDLSVLVSAVDTVRFLAEDNHLLSIIKAICVNERPRLRFLSVYGDDFTQMCISLLLEGHVIGLENLCCNIPMSDRGYYHLVEFLSSQTNIKELQLISSNPKTLDNVISNADNELHVPDSNCCMHDQRLLACVGNLVMRPDFELFKVWVGCAGMTQCAFTVLLNSFLSAPVSKQKKIHATDLNVNVCDCYAQKAITPCKVESNSLEYKEAKFIGDFDYPWLDSILECLSNFEIQLKRLEIESYVLEDINLFTAVFSSPTFAVREVHLYNVEFPKFTSESDYHAFDGLLSKPSLKVFELSGIWGDHVEECPDTCDELQMLVNALTKQALVGTLESFIYNEFDVPIHEFGDVEDLVRALLCLPQFLQLNFSLRCSHQLADMANKIWEECANGRTLKPPPPNYENSLLEEMLKHRE